MKRKESFARRGGGEIEGEGRGGGEVFNLFHRYYKLSECSCSTNYFYKFSQGAEQTKQPSHRDEAASEAQDTAVLEVG